MKLKLIKTEAEYQEALASLEKLMNVSSGSPEEEQLDLLVFLIENYEKVRFSIGLPDPIEAIKFRMEQQGLTRKDLEKYMGSQSKVSEVLNRKRPLSLAMIRSLSEGLGISTDVLLQKNGNPDIDDGEDVFEEDSSLINKTKLSGDKRIGFDNKSDDMVFPPVNWPCLSETARRLMNTNGLSAEVQAVNEQLFARWLEDYLDNARMALDQSNFSDAIQYIRTLRQILEQLGNQSPLIKTYCQAIILLEKQIAFTSRLVTAAEF